MKNYIGMEQTVKEFIQAYFTTIFPSHFGSSDEIYSSICEKEKAYKGLMRRLLVKALDYISDDKQENESKADKLIEGLGEIRRIIFTDISAAYEGDPAAMSEDEIILSYPGFKAISAFRVAHELYNMKVPVIPRMITEQLHQITGIDIHPGATIGEYFFIDHGTGVVIGETTVIGDHVKLYQHVTLGAKSFEVSDDGSLVKGIKRHPNIGNRVVIYAGATVLGGDTYIGDDAVIGGNTWITKSIPEGVIVTIKSPDHKHVLKNEKKEIL